MFKKVVPKDPKFRILHYGIMAALIALPLFHFVRVAHAADLLQRSIQITNSAAGATTEHAFSFNIIISGSVGSMAFQYCDSPLLDVPCVAPAGIDASGATLDSQAGVTGFSVDPSTTSNRLVIGRSPVAETPQPATYTFSNIVNPSAISDTTYVRILTYPTSDGTGPHSNYGAVAFSTARQLGTIAYVPPYLAFCVGTTVALDCSTAAGLSINLGEFASSYSSFATSQFAGATNDPGGYATYITGTTMTSGNNIIDPLTTTSTSQVGTGQFGINLRSNGNPTVGTNRVGSGTAIPSVQYNQTNNFRFTSGSQLTNSPISTDYNRFTVSYLVNVDDDQAPGVYTSTFTYTATAAF